MKSSLQSLALIMVLMLLSMNIQAANWTSKAKKIFEDDEYEACIELAKGYQRENIATMFLAFSHLQENVFNNSKYDKEKFKAYSTKLEAKLAVNDMNDLLYFVQLSDKPLVVKEARNLAKKAFKNINDIDDVPQLVSFLKVEDESIRKMVLTSIQDILKPKRAYISKGGTLREKDMVVMNSKYLINALIEQIDVATAKAALLLIEEPALPYLAKVESIEAKKLAISINKKIDARLKKFPQSNWYSAVGKKR